MIIVHDVRRLAEVFRSLVKQVPRSVRGKEHVDTFTPIVMLYRVAIHGQSEPIGEPHPLNSYSGFVVLYGGARADMKDVGGARAMVYTHPQPQIVASRGRSGIKPIDPRMRLEGIVSVSLLAMDQLRALYRRAEESGYTQQAQPAKPRWDPMRFLPEYDVDEHAKREIDRGLSPGDTLGMIRLPEAFESAFKLWLRVAERRMWMQSTYADSHLLPDYTGRKYVRVWQQRPAEAAAGRLGSIWRFVDAATGDVYLAKDRNAPKGQPVENIYVGH